MSRTSGPGRSGLWLLLFLGSIFFIIGVAATLIFGYIFTGQVRQMEALPLSPAAALNARPPGSQVLVEGQISRRNEKRFRSFVVYWAEEFRGWNEKNDNLNQAIWVEIERVTPPLRLDLPDGPVRIANNDYTFQSGTMGSAEGPVTWQDREDLVWDQSTQMGTRHYTGLEIGSPVLALGVVTETVEGRALRAEWLYGGTRAGYLTRQREAVALITWLGPLFAVIGLGIMALGVWLWRRAPARSPGTAGKRHRF